MIITTDCISCGACEPDCPTPPFRRRFDLPDRRDKCTECVGAFDTPKCVELCPLRTASSSIRITPSRARNLEAKYARLH